MPWEPIQFISAEIDVERDEAVGMPVAFRWEGRRYVIREILASWSDWGFGEGAPKRKTWRMRHHRNFYRVETVGGEVFDLYHDRGVKAGDGVWILHTRMR